VDSDDLTGLQLDISKKSLVPFDQGSACKSAVKFHVSVLRWLEPVVVQGALSFKPLKSPALVGCLWISGYAISGFFPTLLSGLEACVLCYRCGAYTEDGAKKCGECGAPFSAERRRTARKALHENGDGLHGSFPFEVGYKIAGRYRVKSFRDSGAAGWMVRARDENTEQDVAVKVIDSKLIQSEREINNFLAVCRKARKVDHINVARLYEEGREGNVVYYVMQYLEGLTLRRIIDLRIEKKQVFQHNEVLPLFNQLADGLSSLGRFKFHGSIYPGSITVLPDVLKITGVAHYQAIPRRPLIVKHDGNESNHYLAPESRNDTGKPGPRSDVYSLAVIFAEMMSGVVYGRDSAARWDGAREVLGENMFQVLSKALSINPEGRFESASSFVDALFNEVDDSDFPVVEIEEDDGLEATPVVIAEEMLAANLLPDDDDDAESVELNSGVFEIDEVEALLEIEADDTASDNVDIEEITGVDLVIGDDSQVEQIAELGELKIKDLPPTKAMHVAKQPSANGRWIGLGIILLGVVVSAAILINSGSDVATPVPAEKVTVIPVPEPPVLIPAVEGEVADMAPGDDAAQKQDQAGDAKPVIPKPNETIKNTGSVNVQPVKTVAPKVAQPVAAPPTPSSERRLTQPPPPPPPPAAVATKRPAAKDDFAIDDEPVIEPEPREPGCRRGMILVEAGAFTVGSRQGDSMRGFGDLNARRIRMDAFCMDIYEYPNSRNRAPKVRVNWSQARSSCRAVGKRLCTEQEWERGCKGPTGTRFPFGNTYREGTCNLSEDGNASVKPSGRFDACRSGFGMADLAGNVAEWTQSSWSDEIADKVVKGGSAEQDMYSGRCSARSNESSGTKDALIGFRCCADAK
jgi:eukaryotic-like serine/threonine-protein kinase